MILLSHVVYGMLAFAQIAQLRTFSKAKRKRVSWWLFTMWPALFTIIILLR